MDELEFEDQPFAVGFRFDHLPVLVLDIQHLFDELLFLGEFFDGKAPVVKHFYDFDVPDDASILESE